MRLSAQLPSVSHVDSKLGTSRDYARFTSFFKLKIDTQVTPAMKNALQVAF